MPAIQTAIRMLTGSYPVSGNLAGEVATEILTGAATPAQIGAFLTALHIRGEQREHLLAFARAMRAVATPVVIQNREQLVDTCGTGGDGAGTFNISTAAALVAAGAGARVAKHGNRAVSSGEGSGSADMLAALGINIECPPETSAKCIDACGFGFFFAPAYHSALRHAAAPRREIGIRSILNLLGPLANPAGATRQVVGVCRPELTDVFAKVLAELGARRVLVVHGLNGADGQDGLDEVSLIGPTRISEVVAGEAKPAITITPEQFGLARCKLADLSGDSAPMGRTRQFRNVLQGDDKGPRRGITLLNAAAALLAAELVDSWEAGIEKAAFAIDSGATSYVIEGLRKCSNAGAKAA